MGCPPNVEAYKRGLRQVWGGGKILTVVRFFWHRKKNFRVGGMFAVGGEGEALG